MYKIYFQMKKIHI